jgi:hypothetical protein
VKCPEIIPQEFIDNECTAMNLQDFVDKEFDDTQRLVHVRVCRILDALRLYIQHQTPRIAVQQNLIAMTVLPEIEISEIPSHPTIDEFANEFIKYSTKVIKLVGDGLRDQSKTSIQQGYLVIALKNCDALICSVLDCCDASRVALSENMIRDLRNALSLICDMFVVGLNSPGRLSERASILSRDTSLSNIV